MADILIRGYSAPISCATCHFNSNLFCDVLGRKVRIPVDYVERPDTCPLVELPPHGDLIDRDAVIDGEADIISSDGYYAESGFSRDMLRCMPVIVPSNKEETE